MPGAQHLARGHVLLVQENRFRLVTDGGQGLLLILAHDANVTPDDLCHFHAAHVPVEVRYSGEPNLTTGVAHHVSRQ